MFYNITFSTISHVHLNIFILNKPIDNILYQPNKYSCQILECKNTLSQNGKCNGIAFFINILRLYRKKV